MSYEPLTEIEFNELKEFTKTIGAYLPDNKATYVWSLYSKLNPNNVGPQPCTCPSSGALWKSAVDYLVNWVRDKNV